MNIVSNAYQLFGLIVSVSICVCIYTILAKVIQKRQHIHLNWLIPMVTGYTLATTITLLYTATPRYWSQLARAGDYPLLIVGFIAGLLMIYGWVRFASIFFRLDQLKGSPPLSHDTVDTKTGVWPPPPTKPE